MKFSGLMSLKGKVIILPVGNVVAMKVHQSRQ